jgi:hypothetical protein
LIKSFYQFQPDGEFIEDLGRKTSKKKSKVRENGLELRQRGDRKE